MSAGKEQMRERVSQTVRLVNHLRAVARENPERARLEAEAVDDPSMKASGLLAVAKVTRDIGPLSDARDIVLGTDMPTVTKANKLAKIAFAAVGADNLFAIEVVPDVPSKAHRSQLRQQLSVALIGPVRRALGNGEYDEVGRYPAMVMAAFHESVGDSNYFGERQGHYGYIQAPSNLIGDALAGPLDPVVDGERALAALRGNPTYCGEMVDFIKSHGGAEPPSSLPLAQSLGELSRYRA